MAASAGHLHKLLAKNVKLLKYTFKSAQHLVQANLPASLRPYYAEIQPILVRNAGARQPVHPTAALRQAKGRWYTTRSAANAFVRRFTTSRAYSSFANGVGGGLRFDKSALPQSRTRAFITASSGRAPFASTLRPNLTGGTLGRTAGGYAMPGSGRVSGARFFSHGPAAPAQVVNNVSQAVRAFALGGQKARFDGVDARGRTRWRAVSALQDEVGRKVQGALPRSSPGSYVDFAVNPTITAITPLTAAVPGFGQAAASASVVQGNSLAQDGLLGALSADFARALKDLSATLADLQRLADLGDLPITYEVPGKKGKSAPEDMFNSSAHILRVHFPGCDADTVERLCAELGVSRGLVHQDPDFDAFAGVEMALLFPLAPSAEPSECDYIIQQQKPQPEQIRWQHMMTPSAESVSLREHDVLSTRSIRSGSGSESGSGELVPIEDMLSAAGQENPWASVTPKSPSGYDSLHTSSASDAHSPLEYRGFEGICRFIEQCDAATSRAPQWR
ncbi:hypothetical protein BDY21DRAFT_419020 [Lineolata rhizophorae]|uniref:Casein kinase II beta 2 subunit n=1 Tax=Lineolata rhizophorae TaxID=578093 RepID=A0A6A6PBM2_9PEZI|nr:hypothetical protein BDY21DRAFT_419020 [Lineolata rhizophorae]